MLEWIDGKLIARLLLSKCGLNILFSSDACTDEHFMKSGDNSIHSSPGMKHSLSEEKLSKMEEVVEKVVELYVENSLDKPPDESAKKGNSNVGTDTDNIDTGDPSKIEENETKESK